MSPAPFLNRILVKQPGDKKEKRHVKHVDKDKHASGGRFFLCIIIKNMSHDNEEYKQSLDIIPLCNPPGPEIGHSILTS